MIREGVNWIGGILIKIFIAGMVFMFLILLFSEGSCSTLLGYSDDIYIAYSSDVDADSNITFFEIEDIEFQRNKKTLWGRKYKKIDKFSIWDKTSSRSFSFNEVHEIRLGNGWVSVWIKGGKPNRFPDYSARSITNFRILGEDSDGRQVTIYPSPNKYMDICFFEPKGNIK